MSFPGGAADRRSHSERHRFRSSSAALRPRQVLWIVSAAFSLLRSASLAARSSRAVCRELEGAGLFRREAAEEELAGAALRPERLIWRGRLPEPVKLNIASRGGGKRLVVVVVAVVVVVVVVEGGRSLDRLVEGKVIPYHH